MVRNIIGKSLSVLLVMVMLTGICQAAETQEPKTAEECLAEKALELGEEYGLISVGTEYFHAENERDRLGFPEDIKEHDCGILFSDIYDYDGDGDPELFLLRREEDFVNYQFREDYVSGVERSEYLFEMYEYREQGVCTLSNRFVVGAADLFTVFTSDTSVTFFRKDLDGRTELFMETKLAAQGQPEDICLVKLRYEDGKFCDFGAIRYGALFFGDGCVRCLEPKSLDAYGLLAIYNSSNNDKLWEVKASSDTYDEEFLDVLKERLKEYGLTLLTTRYEMIHESGQEGSQEKNVKECSALDFYGTEKGELIPLAFTYLRLEGGNQKEGYTYLKRSSTIYTKDPEGAERPAPESGDDSED